MLYCCVHELLFFKYSLLFGGNFETCLGKPEDLCS